MKRKVRIEVLAPSDVLGMEGCIVVAGDEEFQLRRRGTDKRHVYEVWHAFLWGQQPLTNTNWRVCANLEAAVQLMQRFSQTEGSDE